MAKAKVTHCLRCRGTGFRATPVAHCGVPGLCYGCDGDGTRETQLRKQAAEREAKRVQDAYDAVATRVYATRAALGGTAFPPRERRRPAYEAFHAVDFTSEAYAERFGLTKREAFEELCRWTSVYPVVGPDGQATGWQFSR